MFIKILNLVTRIENILGVHRNYYYLPKFGKLLTWIVIFGEIALTVYIAVFSCHYRSELYQRDLMNYGLVIGSSFSIIILSMYNSEKFGNLTDCIKKNHALFANDCVYLKQLDKIFKFLISITIVLFLIKIGLLIYIHIINEEAVFIVMLRVLLYHIFLLMCNMRYSLQYILLYIILFLLSEHIKCITRRITKENVSDIENDDDEDTQINENAIQFRTSFDEWTKVYSDIKKCSNLINTIFGVQITVMLITLTLFFILYLYAFTFVSVNGQLKPGELLVYNYKITVFLLLLFGISRSAQSVRNSSDLLQRRLGRLLINSVSDADTFKATKDFLRLVSNRPIKTQGFGSIDVDMTLVPKFVMFFTSYTVIALQFNNVV